VEQILVNFIAGAVGGHAAGRALPSLDLGTAGSTLAGLAGGGAVGQVIALLLPAVTATSASGDVDLGGAMTHVVAGCVGGAIFAALIGSIENKAA
jgi:hypothetical protein